MSQGQVSHFYELASERQFRKQIGLLKQSSWPAIEETHGFILNEGLLLGFKFFIFLLDEPKESALMKNQSPRLHVPNLNFC